MLIILPWEFTLISTYEQQQSDNRNILKIVGIGGEGPVNRESIEKFNKMRVDNMGPSGTGQWECTENGWDRWEGSGKYRMK